MDFYLTAVQTIGIYRYGIRFSDNNHSISLSGSLWNLQAVEILCIANIHLIYRAKYHEREYQYQPNVTPAGWLLWLQLIVLSRSAIVV